MTALLPVFAVFVPGVPAACAVFAVGRWWHARRRLERVFYEGRERRLNGGT